MTNAQHTLTPRPLCHPPALVIRLELEERPAVYIEAQSEGDEARMWDWVTGNEPLLDLVAHALALADEARAA